MITSVAQRANSKEAVSSNPWAEYYDTIPVYRDQYFISSEIAASLSEWFRNSEVAQSTTKAAISDEEFNQEIRRALNALDEAWNRTQLELKSPPPRVISTQSATQLSIADFRHSTVCLINCNPLLPELAQFQSGVLLATRFVANLQKSLVRHSILAPAVTHAFQILLDEWFTVVSEKGLRLSETSEFLRRRARKRFTRLLAKTRLSNYTPVFSTRPAAIPTTVQPSAP
jgi:hypothetical protein